MAQQLLKSPFEMEERNYSERTAETIDEEVRRILDEIYSRVRELLRANRGPMTRISQALMQKETLEREELDALAAKPDTVRAVSQEVPAASGHS